ncbi:hypothetical protein NGM99_04575 [Mesorhizobium sp. RP14(2022)]|uniref:Uncharacterized protein n=1 Tax=Mesorhizobium liriopis TaxID=2953882 RepID=A0ABT1C2L4_9HYPH|nr:hypothetical protein [Mesorhizobium liriopis]MCO6049061.1 hypothetical protein [Mesorhizobium liriopis]
MSNQILRGCQVGYRAGRLSFVSATCFPGIGIGLVGPLIGLARFDAAGCQIGAMLIADAARVDPGFLQRCAQTRVLRQQFVSGHGVLDHRVLALFILGGQASKLLPSPNTMKFR